MSDERENDSPYVEMDPLRDDRSRRLRALLDHHAVLDALWDGLIIVHASGRIEPLNQAAHDILGRSHRGPLPRYQPGDSGLDVVDPSGVPIPVPQRPAQRALIDRVVVRDAHIGLLAPTPDDDGRRPITWLRLSAFPLPEEMAPDEPAVLLTFVDITAEVDARNEAQTRGARLQQLLDALDDLVLDIGLDGVIRDLPQAERADRPRRTFLPGDLVGQHQHDVLPTEFAEGVARALDRLRRGEPCQPFEFTVPATGSDERAFVAQVATLEGTARTTAGALFVVRDITARRRAEAQVRRSEARLRNLFEKHRAILLQIDPANGRIVDANEAAAEFYGYPRELLRTMRIEDINTLSPDAIASQRAAALEGRRNHFVFPHRLASGEIRHMEVHSSPIATADGVVLFSILNDVTDRLAGERRLEQSAAVFENTSDGVVITDAERHIVAVNRAFSDITLFEESEAIGVDLLRLQSPVPGRGRTRDILDGLQRNDRWQGESVGIRRDGTEYPQWLTTSVVRAPDGSVSNYVTVFSDISPLKAVQARLEHQAHHDDLTRLPNRVLFQQRLGAALKRAARERSAIAVCFLDLDRFKVVNDSLGHATGDRVLCAVAERLRTVSRPGDALARIGGDEFILLVDPAPDRAALVEHVQRILQAMEQPYLLPDAEEIFMGASIGISLFPGDGVSAEELIRNADAALYAAKDAGRGAYHFYREALTVQASARLRLDREMRKALRDETFTLAFQPIVASSDARIIGVETLLRWRSDTLGNLSPAEFIPVAEDTGLIRAIGTWVLRRALATMRRWMDQGIAPQTISVNVSASQLVGVHFPTIVQDALRDTGVPANRLELELTESTLFSNTERMLSLLRELTALGVRVAVDDFGTGYSSLSYLQRFPIHRLKVDRSFTASIPDSESACAISRAIVQLGRTLGLEVLAEGVEKDAQLAFLREIGCDLWQGFLCSPGLPEAEIERLLGNAGASPREGVPGQSANGT